jgi:hypothetical protein
LERAYYPPVKMGFSCQISLNKIPFSGVIWLSHPTRAFYPTILGGKIFLFAEEGTPLSGETAIAVPVKKGTKKHGKVHRQGKRKEARYP